MREVFALDDILIGDAVRLRRIRPKRKPARSVPSAACVRMCGAQA